MTRIIAGTARGQRLSVPPGSGTRPTADRVRESLMATIGHEMGGFAGLAVLDLYAGSGALGLEAVSRGATRAVLVERDRRAAATIAANAARLAMPQAQVVTASVASFLRRPAEPFDLVFLDPPYATAAEEVTAALEQLVSWLAPGALVVVERATRGPGLQWPAGLAPQSSRTYSETTIWYGQPSAGLSQAPEPSAGAPSGPRRAPQGGCDA